MDHDIRLKRLRFRAWHRGTREADLMIGGFFDAHGAGWSPDQLGWFEALLEEQDVDIMGWAIGSIPCPPQWDGAMMQAMRDCGCTLNNAYMQHSLLALVVIPELRISDLGLVDVRSFEFIPLLEPVS